MNIFDQILKRPLFNLLILLTVWIPGHSLGWAIIVLTIFIRSLLLPSSAHALKQQHKLKKIQPEIKEIQDRHKNDQTAQAAAMMALYKKYDIHPLGSCLPMLIQLPVLFALYYVFRDGIDPAHLDSLYSFVPRPDTINTIFLGIDLGQANRILAVAAGAAQFVQTWMLTHSSRTHQPENATQKMLNTQLIYVMPVITILISFSLPAALPLYWLTTTLFSVAQQWWLFRHLDAATVVPVAVAPNSAPQQQPAQIQTGKVQVEIRKRGEGK